MHRPTNNISPNRLRLLAALLYTLAVVGVSLYPLSLPRAAQGTDKAVHFGLYFFLLILWHRAGFPGKNLWWKLVLLGGAVEILQSLLPVHRTGDVWDAAANTLGVLTALYICETREER